jgi:predicted nucleotidyltransferase
MLKKILNESQSISLKIPDNLEVYLFGSSVCSANFNDIDLLFVVPNDVVDKVKLYDVVRTFCQLLSQKLGHVIDFTILTQSEEEALSFIENARALPVQRCSQKQTTLSNFMM